MNRIPAVIITSYRGGEGSEGEVDKVSLAYGCNSYVTTVR